MYSFAFILKISYFIFFYGVNCRMPKTPKQFQGLSTHFAHFTSASAIHRSKKRIHAEKPHATNQVFSSTRPVPARCPQNPPQ